MRRGKDDVVEVLTRLGQALRARGDTYRARAYLNAAKAIAATEDLEALYDKGKLQEIEGVGASIERTIVAFVERGEEPEGLAAEPEEEAAVDVAVPQTWARGPFQDAPDLHVHTTWSDGTLSLDEVVAFARKLGAQAIGISDHSGSLRIARGLEPASVRAQWTKIARAQRDHPDIQILRGTECDILRDGTLDHPDDLLAEFDYVIGSLHSHLKLGEREQTERVLRALDNEHLTILGHPTTRVPNRRPPAHLDLDAVFAKAADRGVAMEVNGNPGRLDLDATLARRALAAGCSLALGSDGHSAREMLALATARSIAAEAGATREQIVNYDVLRAARRIA